MLQGILGIAFIVFVIYVIIDITSYYRGGGR